MSQKHPESSLQTPSPRQDQIDLRAIRTTARRVPGGLTDASMPEVDPTCPCGREVRQLCEKEGIQPGLRGCIKS